MPLAHCACNECVCRFSKHQAGSYYCHIFITLSFVYAAPDPSYRKRRRKKENQELSKIKMTLREVEKINQLKVSFFFFLNSPVFHGHLLIYLLLYKNVSPAFFFHGVWHFISFFLFHIPCGWCYFQLCATFDVEFPPR